MISLPFSLPEEYLSHFFAMFEALRVLIAATTCLCTCEGFFSSAFHLISARAHAGRLQNGEISPTNHGSPYKADSFALSCNPLLLCGWGGSGTMRRIDRILYTRSFPANISFFVTCILRSPHWCVSHCNLFFFLCSTRLATSKLVIREHECITSYIVRSDCFVR